MIAIRDIDTAATVAALKIELAQARLDAATERERAEAAERDRDAAREHGAGWQQRAVEAETVERGLREYVAALERNLRGPTGAILRRRAQQGASLTMGER